MARHCVPASDESLEIFVGWDSEMKTFWGSVYKCPESDVPTLWMGYTTGDQMLSPLTLEKRLSPYLLGGKFPEGLVMTLVKEQRGKVSLTTSLIRFIKGIFS